MKKVIRLRIYLLPLTIIKIIFYCSIKSNLPSTSSIKHKELSNKQTTPIFFICEDLPSKKQTRIAYEEMQKFSLRAPERQYVQSAASILPKSQPLKFTSSKAYQYSQCNIDNFANTMEVF